MVAEYPVEPFSKNFEASAHLDGRAPVTRAHRKVDVSAVVLDLEIGRIVLARKNASAGEAVQQRARVAARDEDALASLPLDGKAMRRVFAARAQEGRKVLRPELLEGMRQMPAMAAPACSFGFNPRGNRACTTAGSTRKLISMRRLITPSITGRETML
jgi:hypothetical protein